MMIEIRNFQDHGKWKHFRIFLQNKQSTALMRIKFIYYLKSLSRLANLLIGTMHFPSEQPETKYQVNSTEPARTSR